jgi:leucyl aminopeptidase
MFKHLNLTISSIPLSNQYINVTLKNQNDKKHHEFIYHEKNHTLNLFILKSSYNTNLDYEYLGGEIVTELLPYGENFNLDLNIFSMDEAAYIINGVYLRSWCFNEYKKKKKLESIVCYVAQEKETLLFFDTYLKKISDGVIFAKKLCALPPNILTPIYMVEEIQKLFQNENDVIITVLNKNDILAKKMNLLYNVAKGSIYEPYVVIIEKNKHLLPQKVFLGKGVTFDTGGISLKPSDSMITMKEDMAGAAAIIGAIYGTQEPVIGIVGLVENMIGAKAQRVSDIITSMSGDTVEIINTDAEGRLILADLMTLAQTFPHITEIIDLATLTGAVGVALGKEYAAIMSNNQNLVYQLIQSGINVGELLWQLPCGVEYNHHLKSESADISNVGTKGESGTIAGAKFIEFFLKDKNIAWSHIDIASVIKKKNQLSQESTNGFGVRLLVQYLKISQKSCCVKEQFCCNKNK